jgi:DNA-directed RNA polymerase beta subunit
MRRILAIGGGGFTTEKEPSPIDAYIRELVGKSHPRICFIATPSGDNAAQIDKFHAAYGVGLAEMREARRGAGMRANTGLRNSQYQYGIGIFSGSESRP